MGKKIHTLLQIPNLLSLDAPLVAFLWMMMLVDHYKMSLWDYPITLVICASIWVVYVLDRTLDVWSGRRKVSETKRHAFAWKYKKILLPLAIIILVAVVYASLSIIPVAYFTAGMVLALLAAVYFLLIPSQSEEVPYLKNLMAGLVFAMGIGIPTQLLSVSMRVDILSVLEPFDDPHFSFVMALFEGLKISIFLVMSNLAALMSSFEILALGLVCLINITLIDLWERTEKDVDKGKFNKDGQLVSGFMILLTMVLCLVNWVQNSSSGPAIHSSYYFYALAAATLLLFCVNSYKKHFNLELKRILADIALVIPPVFYFSFKFIT
ncbi:hypothetical protein OAB00_03175 [Akkermansiaceae bacterium]|nr:hypothetical protein [Akkermansiaceae bacterium]